MIKLFVIQIQTTNKDMNHILFKVEHFLESAGFQRTLTAIICINAILIGLETNEQIVESFGGAIDLIDYLILAFFVIELSVKLVVYRGRFFKSGWNLFDALIVLISVLPAAGSFTVFRALRVVRTLRLLKNVPKLRLIIESLIHSVPSIGWISVLLMVLFYVYAVVGHSLFSETHPVLYGDLSKSFFTLFQIMTLESWATAIARPVMMNGVIYGLYFVSFILIATYTTLNLFIAIVVNTMNELNLRDIQSEEKKMLEILTSENQQIKNQIQELKELIIADNKKPTNEIYEIESQEKGVKISA
ncbi:ion transporter [Reichenbachiella versicolor]|uniref:ion transporter n=1 Tax=Reichenbachiella versicolor TaxID=1821036 RepID=UPI000D6DF564|nr:ion transporter [Reichenbachiella versicolor]